MAETFEDLQARANKLHSALAQKSFMKRAFESTSQAGSERESPYSNEIFARDLNAIFAQSEHIWKKASITAPVQKNLLFGEKGVIFGVPVPQLSDELRLVDGQSQADGIEEREEDVSSYLFIYFNLILSLWFLFLRKYREKNTQIKLDVERQRVKLEAERSFFNHVLQTRPQFAIPAAEKVKQEAKQQSVFSPIDARATDRNELVFGDKIRKYIRSGKQKDLLGLLKSAVEETHYEGTLAGLWAETFALADRKIVGDREKPEIIAQIIDSSIRYLNQLYVDHMNAVVERNLQRAERGGVPGLKALVQAYMKVCEEYANPEDGIVDELPVWEIIYNCLRAGQVAESKNALDRLADAPQSAYLLASLNHLCKHEKLDVELKKNLKTEWRHVANTAKDPFKRALYAALLGLESPLADTMENWIWFKLFALKVDPHLTTLLYTEVQKTVAIDYGESYFMGENRDQFHLFYTALIMSGQFERAVNLLFNCDQVSDAVHVGILFYEQNLLRTPKNTAADMLVIDPSEPTRCSLNLARLVVAYTKQFELYDVGRALDYWFLLKGLQTPSGSDVFYSAVSRGVYLTGNVEGVLGAVDFGTGLVREGYIYQYVNDPSEVIEFVASDTEASGEVRSAVGLYLLANRPTKAANLLSSEIVDSVRGHRKDLEALLALAEDFLRVQQGCDPPAKSTLSKLVDICAIMKMTESGEAEKVYNASKALRLVPTTEDTGVVFVGEFHRVSQKVREVLPEFCLALMRCFVAEIKNGRGPIDKYIKQVIRNPSCTPNFTFYPKIRPLTKLSIIDLIFRFFQPYGKIQCLLS
ncbi:hypothetical protein WR25_27108 isoform E [Diploscapter pachys]|uniref:Nuclear pore protein n=1 Tax=Diploscapter pachys TaxID=2018661 RepID=A0A2A2KJL1_9BILA|nr:hypothetical protein WR25_27108 isoform E [Diploscapter pachys]